MKILNVKKVSKDDPRISNYDLSNSIYEYDYISEKNKKSKVICYGNTENFMNILNTYYSSLQSKKSQIDLKISTISSIRRIIINLIASPLYLGLSFCIFIPFGIGTVVDFILNFLFLILTSATLIVVNKGVVDFINSDIKKILKDEKVLKKYEEYKKQLELISEYKKECEIEINKQKGDTNQKAKQQVDFKRYEDLFFKYNSLPISEKLLLYHVALTKGKSNFIPDVPLFLQKKEEEKEILRNFALHDEEIRKLYAEKASEFQKNKEKNSSVNLGTEMFDEFYKPSRTSYLNTQRLDSQSSEYGTRRGLKRQNNTANTRSYRSDFANFRSSNRRDDAKKSIDQSRNNEVRREKQPTATCDHHSSEKRKIQFFDINTEAIKKAENQRETFSLVKTDETLPILSNPKTVIPQNNALIVPEAKSPEEEFTRRK